MTEDSKNNSQNNIQDSTQGNIKESSFENAYSELENIVKRMELGDQGLEDSLADFEKGIQLIKQCHTHIQTAEQRIHTIQKSDGKSIIAKPFESSES